MRKILLALCLSALALSPADGLAQKAQQERNPRNDLTLAPLPGPQGTFPAAIDLPQGPTENDLKELARQQAFEAALASVFPLRPDEIREVIRQFKEVRRAAEEDTAPPEPEIKVETLSLDPSREPPIIMLATGHVTSLTILDVTGQPWPIQDVSWGGDFDILTPESKGHVIRITPMKAHAIGNMSIRMIGLATPITFTLRTQREIVHYRFDARIPDFGPFSEPPLIDRAAGIMAGDLVLTSVLDGLVPEGAERLGVSGTDGRTSAWEIDGSIYVRTPLTLLSPAWDSSASSADGTTVYELAEAPVLLLSDKGQIVRVSISRGDAANER